MQCFALLLVIDYFSMDVHADFCYYMDNNKYTG